MKKLFFAFLAIALVMASCTKSDTKSTRNPNHISGTGYLKNLPDSGLIALYEFTGNVNDGSGNNNNGTIHGNVTYCPDRFNNPNQAVHLDGSIGTYITTVTGGTLGSSPRSVCFWVRSTSYNMQYLISYGDTVQTGRSFGTALNNPCPGIGFDNGNGVAMRGNDSLLNGAWHQLVIVFDAFQYGPNVSDGKFYIDGILTNTINCTAVGNTPVNTLAGCPFTIGADLGGSRNLNGSIDDIRFYNRALTDAEIFSLFNAPNPVNWRIRSVPMGIAKF